MPRASVTCDTFHWLMSTLKSVLPSNKKLMSVTRDTSQWGMVSSHSLSPTHESTAALSSAPVVTSRVHTATSVSTRSVHDVTPSSTYPVLHSGTQDVPLTRVSVQVPTSPLRGGRDASHASSLRVQPLWLMRVFWLPPWNRAVHAPAINDIRVFRETLDVSQPTGFVLNAWAFQTMPCMSVTELTSHLDRCWLNALAHGTSGTWS